MGDVASGSAGFFQFDTESIPGGSGTPGVVVPRVERLYLSGLPTLQEAPAVQVPVSPDGGRVSDPLVFNEASQIAGNVPTKLMANNGIKLLVGTIGTDILEAAGLAPATTASIARVGDNHVLTFAAMPAFITKKGQLFLADVADLQEIRPVLAFDPTAKTVTTGAFRKTHTGTIAVSLPANHHVREYTSLDGSGGLESLLRTFSGEENIGGKYAELYPNLMANQATIASAQGGLNVTYAMVGSSPKVTLGRGDFTVRNLSDPTRPDKPTLTTQGFLAFPIDPSDSGSPTIQRVVTAETWQIVLNNNCYVNASNFDDTDVLPWTPGNWEVSVTMQRRLKDSLPTGFNSFLKKQITAEFFAFMWVNLGTESAPNMQAICFHATNLFYHSPYAVGRAPNQPVTEQITARAIRENGGSKIEAFIVNSNVSAAY